MLGIPDEAAIDVLNDETAEHYFAHSDRFHVALDLTSGRRGHEAVAAAMARWVKHLLDVDVDIEPTQRCRPEQRTSVAQPCGAGAQHKQRHGPSVPRSTRRQPHGILSERRGSSPPDGRRCRQPCNFVRPAAFEPDDRGGPRSRPANP